MEKIQISREVFNVVLNYLASRPYKEVAGIVKVIQDELNSEKEESSNESED